MYKSSVLDTPLSDPYQQISDELDTPGGTANTQSWSDDGGVDLRQEGITSDADTFQHATLSLSAESRSADPTRQHTRSAFQALKRMSRRRSKLYGIREQVLHLRIGVDYEWQKMESLRKFCQQSQDAFMDAIDRVIAGDTLSDHAALLRDLHRTANNHNSDLNQQRELVRSLSSTLNDVETELSACENSVCKSLETAFHAVAKLYPRHLVDLGSIASSSVAGSETSRSRSILSETLNPCLEQYYDKLGDLGLLAEDLTNLQADHEMATVDRAFQMEHDETPIISDVQFERDHWEARCGIEEKITFAIREAEHLKQLCRDVGISLNTAERPRSETTDELLLDRADDRWQPRTRADARKDDNLTIPQTFRFPHSGSTSLLFGEKEARATIISGRFDDSSSTGGDVSEAHARVLSWNVEPPMEVRTTSAPPWDTSYRSLRPHQRFEGMFIAINDDVAISTVRRTSLPAPSVRHGFPWNDIPRATSLELDS